MHAGYENNAGEWTIDEDTVNIIIEYHLEQCAKDGFKFSQIHGTIHVFYWSWIIESWIKNISDKWKWKDEYYGRVAKKILIPCNDGVGWLVKDWFFFIVQNFYQFWSSLDSKSKIMHRSITKDELKSLTGLIQTKRKFI